VIHLDPHDVRVARPGRGRRPRAAGVHRRAAEPVAHRARPADSRWSSEGSAAGPGLLVDWFRADGDRLKCCGRGRRRRAAATCAGGDGVVVQDGVAVADAGLGQVGLHIAGRLPVAGEGDDDRAGLLVAGGQQERRRLPVGPDPDRVLAGFGVGEFVDAVRRDGAAGVQVGVDQRGAGAGRVTGADHEGAAAGEPIPIAAQHVRQGGFDVRGRGGLAAGAAQPVQAKPGDRGDPRAIADVGFERRQVSEGLQGSRRRVGLRP
jgi:hypothetical protein